MGRSNAGSRLRCSQTFCDSPPMKLSYTGEGINTAELSSRAASISHKVISWSAKIFSNSQDLFLKTRSKRRPKRYRHANLGWLYAFMGRTEDAIREGRRAVELKPESKDAVDGVTVNCYLALIYARVGEKDLAFPLLQRLLKTPGAVDSVDYSITINDLKHRWEWDPIRSDPRFQKLLEQPAK